MQSITELPPPIINHLSIDNTTRLTIQIIGYQYPELQIDEDTHDLDANWYNLRIDIKQAEKRHAETVPAILTEELINLIGWFDMLARNLLQDGSTLEFYEPWIALKYISRMDQYALIGITLNNEIKPDLPQDEPRESTDDWTIILKLSMPEIREILDNLDQVLVRFPCR